MVRRYKNCLNVTFIHNDGGPPTTSLGTIRSSAGPFFGEPAPIAVTEVLNNRALERSTVLLEQ